MVSKPQAFRHHQIVRAFRAAEAAGVRDPTVRFVLPNGTQFQIAASAGGKPDAATVLKPAKTRQRISF
jgi:hypothetical protein